MDKDQPSIIIGAIMMPAGARTEQPPTATSEQHRGPVPSWFRFQTKISLIGPSPSSINFMVRPMTGISIFVWSSPSWCTIVACKSL
jgi:hypothetical protein